MSQAELAEKAGIPRGAVTVAEADGANPAGSTLGDIRAALIERAEESGVALDIDNHQSLVATPLRNRDAARLQRLLTYLPIIPADVDDMDAVLHGPHRALLIDLASHAHVEPSYVAAKLFWLFSCALEATAAGEWPRPASQSLNYAFMLLPDTADVAATISTHRHCTHEIATRYLRDLNQTAWSLWVASDSDRLPG